MTKARLLSLHRWIALALAPLILVQIVTGTILLLPEAFETRGWQHSTSANLARAVEPSPSKLIDTALSKVSGGTFARLFFSGKDRAVHLVRIDSPGGPRFVAISPVSGGVVDRGSIWRFPYEAALELHYRLMSPVLGAAIVMVVAGGFLLLIVAGVATWWPGARNVARSIRVRRSLKGPARLRAWHRSVGAAASVTALFSASTGFLLASTIFPWNASEPEVRSMRIDLSRVDTQFRIAAELVPDGRARDLRLFPDGSIQVNFDAPRRNSRAVDTVVVPADPAQPADVLRAEDNDAPWVTVLPLHSGETFGPLGRVVLLAGCAALLFLIVSGPLAWWRRRRTRGSK
ncbi:PepSY-associated TM helix domain-containing protein [Novosphingobium marinum]|nr:PepSY-associated TM helix domain-containing protein [Novosphingobium marinum]